MKMLCCSSSKCRDIGSVCGIYLVRHSYLLSTIWVANSLGAFSVTRKPSPGRSIPVNIASPWPSATGAIVRCFS